MGSTAEQRWWNSQWNLTLYEAKINKHSGFCGTMSKDNNIYFIEVQEREEGMTETQKYLNKFWP